jgi:hypothetical protein
MLDIDPTTTPVAVALWKWLEDVVRQAGKLPIRQPYNSLNASKYELVGDRSWIN